MSGNKQTFHPLTPNYEHTHTNETVHPVLAAVPAEDGLAQENVCFILLI